MTTFKGKISQVFSLVLPYGRMKLAAVFTVAVIQGLFQVAGVTSIFPFLALVANPEGFMNSAAGQFILRLFPELSERNLLFLAGGFAIVMLALSNVVLLCGELVRTRYVQGLGHWLRTRLLSRIVSNPYHYFLNHNTGELLKKTSSDVMTFITGTLAPMMDLFARAIMVILLIIVLVFIDPLLTLAAGITLGLFYTMAYRILAPVRKRMSDGLKAANRGAMKQAIQTLAGIKPIKVHNVELPFLKVYGGHSAQQARLSKWAPILANTPRYFIEPIAFGGIVGVVLFFLGTGKPIESILPSLGVMALAGYRILPNLQLMYGAFSGISVSSHALEEIREELLEYSVKEHKVDFVDPSNLRPVTWEKKIRLEHISFTYEGAQHPVLADINLEFPKNQFFAIIGETGSGKSTLIDLILGLHWPQSGTIQVDGKELTQDSLRAWRAGIGYVPQEIFLTDDSVAANIAFGVEPSRIDMDRVREVASAAQIFHFIEEDLPQGFETHVGERGVRLSGGQRQRIGLARALYHQPSLLILDEATSALDNQTEAALMAAIERLQGKMSILAIAHRLTTVQRADQVVLLSKGRITRQGTYDEVVSELPDMELQSGPGHAQS